MASELELRWLKVNELKGAAKQFAAFCKKDIEQQANQKGFELDVYQDAIKLVVSKLDKSISLDKLTQRIADEAEEAEQNDEASSEPLNDLQEVVADNPEKSDIAKELEAVKQDAEAVSDDISNANADINTHGEKTTGGEV